MRVLVTDGGNRNALAIVRPLGRRWLEVWAGHRSRRAQAFYSRYCTRSFRYPAPSTEYDRFVEFMLGFLRRRPGDVLIPTSDYSTLFASTHREEPLPSFVSPYRMPLPYRSPWTRREHSRLRKNWVSKFL